MRLSRSEAKWKVRSSLQGLGVWPQVERARLAGRLLLRRPHEPDFAFFARWNGREGLFVDVGANIGQSAISFSIFNRTFKILSFEPNPLAEPELRFVKRLLGSRFTYRMEGLGAESGTRTLYCPVVDGVPLMQEGTLVAAQISEDPVFLARLKETTGQQRYKLQSTELKILKLDELGLEPDAIKIDVQGHEVEALEGMRETLARSRPLLMIENGPGMSKVGELLRGLGYGAPSFYDPGTGELVATAVDDSFHLNLFFA